MHDEKNVIHRDVKPENAVIMDYNELQKVKLIDFGLAVKSTKLEILDYAKCGTLLYTPPEQISNSFAYAKVSGFGQLIPFVESRHVGSWDHALSDPFQAASVRRLYSQPLNDAGSTEELQRNHLSPKHESISSSIAFDLVAVLKTDIRKIFCVKSLATPLDNSLLGLSFTFLSQTAKRN